ncbi:MAG: tetratricopeptide repeat protein [Thermoplasmata archaeon]
MYKILQTCAARLRRNPDDPDALFYIGAIYAKIGKLRASMLYLNRLAKIDEDYPGIWKLKAGIFRRLGSTDLSVMCLERAELSQ